MPRAGDLTPSYCHQGRRAPQLRQAVRVRRHLPLAAIAKRANHASGNSRARTPPDSRIHRQYIWLPSEGAAIAAPLAASSFWPSSNQTRPARLKRANGLARSQPNKSRGVQPSASAQGAQPSSRNRPQSSINRSPRSGGMSQGGQAGSSRASASAQVRVIPPSYSMRAARPSFSHRSQVSGETQNSAAPVSRSTEAGVRGGRRRFSFRVVMG